MPDLKVEDWRVMVDGRVLVFDEDGDKAETNYITYIDWKDDDGIHYPGEVIQFNIEEVPLEKLTCTIKLGNFSSETSLLSMLEDDKIWP